MTIIAQRRNKIVRLFHQRDGEGRVTANRFIAVTRTRQFSS
jgi:hypothetical protein